MTVLEGCLITFVSSFCILVIELITGRMLAPFVGVSLYTWTSIIGVILLGLSIGSYLGGRLADRFPHFSLIGWLLILSGCAALSVSPVMNIVTSYSLDYIPLMTRILIITIVIFFMPSCVLGMISPAVIRLIIKETRNAGHIVGKIYALSTAGSILGTFLTGYFLISCIGTRNLTLLIAALLIIQGVYVSLRLNATKTAIVAALVPAAFVWTAYDTAYVALERGDVIFFKESDYFTIKVVETISTDSVTNLNALILDNLLHSYVKSGDPLYIEYKYEKIYTEVLKWRFRQDDCFSTLTIGGGGYTMPRYMEVMYPCSRIDVVEIDPEVMRTAYVYFGLPVTTRIRTYVMDGRWFVSRSREIYDIVFIDTFNDLSVPYHLTTREFGQQLKEIMRPNSLLLTNIVDNFQRGLFLASYVRTLREVFGSDKVYLISVNPNYSQTRISQFIIGAVKGEIDMKDFEGYVRRTMGSTATSTVVPQDYLDKVIGMTTSVILTDDYSPVDNLIAPVFNERFGYKRE